MRTPVLKLCLVVLAAAAPVFSLHKQSQQYLYTNDNVRQGNTTTALKVSKSGSLSLIATYSTGGDGAGNSSYWAFHPATSAITKTSQCLFVANGGSDPSTIAAFQINITNGTLKAVHGSPFSYGVKGPQISGVGLGVGLNELLFVSNSKFNSISVLQISSNCSLKLMSTATLSYSPVAMRVTPNNKYLVVSAMGPVDSFSIDYKKGEITELGPFKSKGSPAGVDVSCDNSMAFFGDAATHTQVEVFKIMGDGSLTETQNFVDGNGSNSNNVLLSADGTELYVTNNQSNQISVLSVDSAGTLAFEKIVNLKKPGEYASALSTNPAGNQVYVAETNNPWAIGVLTADGANLSEISGSPFAVVKNGFDPPGIVAVPKRVCK